MRRQRGVTLIELMVAIVISSLLAIAVASVLAGFEGRRRTSSSINDLNQTGSYVAWVLDAQLRNAGSGFVQTAAFGFGCKLLAARNGNKILPAAKSLDAPFDSIGQSFRLAPVLIVQNGTTPADSGNGSDVLVVMGGAAGKGEAPIHLDGYPAAATLTLQNTLGFAASDLILLADPQVGGSGQTPCMLSQVSGSFTQQKGATALPLAGDYYQAGIDTQTVASYTGDAVVLNLGNIAAANPPSFSLIGVGDHSSLYAYDLLQTSGMPLKAITTGVFELHALYGLDNNGDGKVETWAVPSGNYSYASLSAGTTAAAGMIARIKAIRVGLILRTPLREKTDVSPSAPSLFRDLGASFTYSPTLNGDNTKYRYRTVEFTAPLRNAMLLE